MNNDKKNTLMNTLMYDALRNAGVKEADARAAAIEAGRNDLRSTMLEYAIKELRTELRGEITKLRAHVDTSIAKETQRIINTILIAIGVATTALSSVISLVIFLT